MSTNTVTPTETTHALCDRIGARLDRVEQSLPTLPAAWLSLNRAVFERVGSTAGAVASRLGAGVGRFTGDAGTAVAMVRGQARSGVERIGSTVERTAKETAGQAGTQAENVAEEAVDTATELVEDAERTVHPTKAELDSMTKSELYDRAQALDIDGRSTMDKGELIDAIVDAES